MTKHRSWRGAWSLPFVPAVVIAGLWQLSASASPALAFLIGSPAGIVREASASLWSGELMTDAMVTTVEAVLGFILGSIAGSALGLFLWFSPLAHRTVHPYLVAGGAVPAFALGPVFIFWFGTGVMSKVMLAFLSTVFIATAQAHAGASQTNDDFLRLVRAFGGQRTHLLRLVAVPAATFWVLAGLRLNIGMALLGAFVAEFIASERGLGHRIIVAEGLFNVNQIWVGVFTLIGIALLFHHATVPVERWAERRQ